MLRVVVKYGDGGMKSVADTVPRNSTPAQILQILNDKKHQVYLEPPVSFSRMRLQMDQPLVSQIFTTFNSNSQPDVVILTTGPAATKESACDLVQSPLERVGRFDRFDDPRLSMTMLRFSSADAALADGLHKQWIQQGALIQSSLPPGTWSSPEDLHKQWSERSTHLQQISRPQPIVLSLPIPQPEAKLQQSATCIVMGIRPRLGDSLDALGHRQFRDVVNVPIDIRQEARPLLLTVDQLRGLVNALRLLQRARIRPYFTTSAQVLSHLCTTTPDGSQWVCLTDLASVKMPATLALPQPRPVSLALTCQVKTSDETSEWMLVESTLLAAPTFLVDSLSSASFRWSASDEAFMFRGFGPAIVSDDARKAVFIAAKGSESTCANTMLMARRAQQSAESVVLRSWCSLRPGARDALSTSALPTCIPNLFTALQMTQKQAVDNKRAIEGLLIALVFVAPSRYAAAYITTLALVTLPGYDWIYHVPTRVPTPPTTFTKATDTVSVQEPEKTFTILDGDYDQDAATLARAEMRDEFWPFVNAPVLTGIPLHLFHPDIEHATFVLARNSTVPAAVRITTTGAFQRISVLDWCLGLAAYSALGADTASVVELVVYVDVGVTDFVLYASTNRGFANLYVLWKLQVPAGYTTSTYQAAVVDAQKLHVDQTSTIADYLVASLLEVDMLARLPPKTIRTICEWGDKFDDALRARPELSSIPIVPAQAFLPAVPPARDLVMPVAADAASRGDRIKARSGAPFIGWISILRSMQTSRVEVERCFV